MSSTLTRHATEAQMVKLFTDLAVAGGGHCWHIRDARGQQVAGCPDIILAIEPVIAFYEIKTQRDVTSPLQARVLDLLTRCDRIESGIVRPVPKQEGELTMDEAVWRIVRHRPDLEVVR